MTRYTTEHFVCDCCKVKKDHILMEGITISTKKSHLVDLSFCSIGCFITYLNNLMKEDKTGVKITDDS